MEEKLHDKLETKGIKQTGNKTKVQREELNSIIQNKNRDVNALFINLKEFITKD